MTSIDHATIGMSPAASIFGSESPTVPSYREPRLPEIDYDAHPAYGGTFAPASLSERLRALMVFTRGFIFVAIRKLVDYENMPLLSKEKNGRKLTLSFALRYMATVASVRVSRLWRWLTGTRRVAVPANPALYEKIKADGAVGLTLSPADLEAIRNVAAGPFATLDARRAAIPLEKRKFDDNIYWCTRTADPQVFATVDEIFKRNGIIDAASAYLGRPVGVKHINPQVNQEDYAFWKRLFADTNVPDPSTAYCHIDATYGMLKGAIYMHEMGPDNGPFCYVRGSQNARVGFLEGMIRRTNDFCGLSGRKRETRQQFMALPRWLRKKADFGGDVLDGTPASDRLREGQITFTSQYGNCVIFDGHGIHRGGMVNKGERRALFILLAEI